MRKILFNDKYGLTQAVLEGRKTMTRRVIPDKLIQKYGHNKFNDRTFELIRHCTTYQIGEEVAVAQCYEDAILSVGEEVWNKQHKWYNVKYCCHEAGLHNKMFVKAFLMPHRIKITNIKIERLQDISDEDAKREGLEVVYYGNDEWYKICSTKNGIMAAQTAREAFAALIDKISGKGTWDRNPFCFCYEFELVK